jgi:hypothetical protein
MRKDREKKRRLGRSLLALLFVSLLSVFLLLSALSRRQSQSSSTEQSAKQRLLQDFASRAEGKHRDLPVFVLAVGLPKTGTTSLQCSLCSRSNETEPILLKDNFVYLGTCPYQSCDLKAIPEQFLWHHHPSFFTGKRTKEAKANRFGAFPHSDTERIDTSDTLPELADTFVDMVNDARGKGLNAITVFEGFSIFSARHIKALADFLNPNWNVHVIVSYRPLYAWLPSKYNSVFKSARNKATHAWPGKEHHAIPTIRGERMLFFDLDGRKDFTDYVHELERYQQHPTQIVRENYLRQFDTVSIVPLHQIQAHGKGDAALDYLFCHVLENAANTCSKVREGLIGSGRANPSETMNYDFLAVAAYEQDLIPHDDSIYIFRRRIVTSLIKRRQEDFLNLSSQSFPLTCMPNATLSRLEDLSLLVERKLFRDTWTVDQERDHHLGFVKSIPKFCYIDANKTLEDETWRSWFPKIGKRKTGARKEQS